MDEFKLSYTASEINEKLGKVDRLVATVNGVSPDASGNVEIASNTVSGGIIDVLELPTDGISDSSFYRLLTACFVNGKERVSNAAVYCVDRLPEIGEIVSDTSLSYFIAYYNVQDNDVYGYVDSTLGGAFGVPAGWYTFTMLASISGLGFNGVVTDIEDVSSNNYFTILLEYVFYIYKNEWIKVPFAYEKAPKFDITWDGDMTDRTVIDMSMLGYDAGTYFVKVSDEVLSTDDVIGGSYEYKFDEDNYTIVSDIDEYTLDTVQFPGAFTISNWVVIVQDEETLATALGVPAGFITNGVYYLLVENSNRIIRLTTPARITKIDEKYLPDMSVDVNSLGLHSVATSGNYNDLYNTPNLNNYVTTSTLNSRLNSYITSSQVDTKIAEAIGSAIGGSY